jgi:hypothetical protein
MTNTDRQSPLASTPSACLHLLSRRVKRLEFLRRDACAHRDRVRVAFIDRLIKNTVLEWCDLFVVESDRSAFASGK